MAYLQPKNGRKLSYEEEGAGQPVVFIHGWKASANVYEEPSRLLTAEGSYRCVRYDHCGHMRSDSPEQPVTLQTLAEDLRELITALQLEKPGHGIAFAIPLSSLAERGALELLSGFSLKEEN